jgi:hypothetical protein
MKTIRGLATLACFLLPSLSQAQGIGSRLPVVELEGYTNTAAKSFDEFMGRAVLIEFFAFW